MNPRPIDDLQDCLDRLAAGEDLDAVLAHHPSERQALAAMLAAANRVRAAHARPDAAFRARTRARLVSRAAATRRDQRHRAWTLRIAVLAVGTACLVLLYRGVLPGRPPGAVVTTDTGRQAATAVARLPRPTALARRTAPVRMRIGACPGAPGCSPADNGSGRPVAGARPDALALAPLTVIVVLPGATPELPSPAPTALPTPSAGGDAGRLERDHPHEPSAATAATPATPGGQQVPPTGTPADQTPPAPGPTPTVVACGGTIAGTVRDHLGRPVAGGIVTAHTAPDGAAEALPATRSWPDGTYVIAGLCPGAYLIVAALGGPMSLEGTYDPDANGTADPVTIAPDAQSAGGIDIALTGSRSAFGPPNDTRGGEGR